tara:strand:+ start:128 stop:505 length:378 start_codon:yes stop_codon:yes gene_type:complete
MLFQSIFFVLFSHIVFNIFLYDLYDIKNFSKKIDYLNNNFKVAYVGKYHGQFNFLGRLKKPIAVIDGSIVEDWFKENSNGFVIYNHKIMPDSEDATPYYSQKFRGRTLSVWNKEQVINQLDIFTK